MDNFHRVFYRPDVDLWHYPKGHLPLAGNSRQARVGTIHDLIAQHCADQYPAARSGLAYRYWIAVLKRSIPRFDLILTVSEFSATAIRTFCERHRLVCPPVRVSYEGINLETAGELQKKEDKVVHLSSLEHYKHTRTLLEFWKRLQAVESKLPRLKLIGPLLERDRIAAEALPGVEIASRLPRRDLEKEIGSALALLFFSEVEGFGLPVFEAFGLGTPATFVRGTAVEELLGQGTPGGFFLNDFDSFREGFDNSLKMSVADIKNIAAALQLRFSWERCAEVTVAAYQEVLGHSRGS